MKKLKRIPRFRTLEEEANFWDSHDSADYIDWSKAKPSIFPNLKPTSRAIPIKMPNWLIDRLKYLASIHGTSYQTLLRQFVSKAVQKELKAIRA